MANLTRYFSESEESFIKNQPEAYLRGLVQAAMGVYIEPTPIKEKQRAPIEKKEKRPPVPDIDGVSIGVPIRSDRKQCKVCGHNLNSVNQCSQKSCKKFMKIQ